MASKDDLDDISVRATVRQTTCYGDCEPNPCDTKLDICSVDNNKIFNVQFCNTQGSEISQSVTCTELNEELCSAIEDVPGPIGVWSDNTPSIDLLITCNYKASDFVVYCEDPEGNCPSTFEIVQRGEEDTDDGDIYEIDDYDAIDEIETYKRIRQYLNTYGENEFQANNILAIQNNLYPFLCFQPTTVCRDNSATGVPMERCSMIYSSSELGGLCFDWYLSEYNGLMAQRIDTYCAQFTDPTIIWWEDANGERDPLADFSSQDCDCVNRFSNPTYQIMREATNVVFNDACWYKSCIPDYNQLKPEINMFNPTCPSTICAQIINVVNSSIGRDLNVNQYINCSTSYTLEQEIHESVQNVWSITIAILMLVFVLLISLSLGFVGGRLIGDDDSIPESVQSTVKEPISEVSSLDKSQT
jgi:hypothetical protein